MVANRGFCTTWREYFVGLLADTSHSETVAFGIQRSTPVSEKSRKIERNQEDAAIGPSPPGINYSKSEDISACRR